MLCSLREIGNLIRYFLTIVTAALLAGAASASAEAGQESASPLTQRIVAVGDLHGDLAAWEEIAQEAAIADRKGDWAGGDTIFVQLGDVTDRGPDSRKIIASQRRLREQAARAGGQVIFVIGNHEAMNVTGDLRYVHPGEYGAFRDKKSEARIKGTWKANEEAILAFYHARQPELTDKQIKAQWFAANPPGKLEHRRAWEPGGEYGNWVASLPAVILLGDTLFAHGGLSVERALNPLSAINASIDAALAQGDGIDRAAADDPLGPLWYRGNVMRDERDIGRLSIEDELAQVLAYHGAKRLVVGHTPSIGGIRVSASGQLVQIDTGISAYYGGPRSFLEITGGRLVAHERGADGIWATRILEQETIEGEKQ